MVFIKYFCNYSCWSYFFQLPLFYSVMFSLSLPPSLLPSLYLFHFPFTPLLLSIFVSPPFHLCSCSFQDTITKHFPPNGARISHFKSRDVMRFFFLTLIRTGTRTMGFNLPPSTASSSFSLLPLSPSPPLCFFSSCVYNYVTEGVWVYRFVLKTRSSVLLFHRGNAKYLFRSWRRYVRVCEQGRWRNKEIWNERFTSHICISIKYTNAWLDVL